MSSLSAPALPLGDSDKLQIGEPIYAVGNPIGFLEGTFSDGLVSGIRALENLKLIQMTAPISEGSSGGPVLNANGEVVGVSTAGVKLGQSLNFAVPSNALKKMLGRIRGTNLVVPTPRPKPAASPDRFADYMKWGLPKGAKARLGRGTAGSNRVFLRMDERLQLEAALAFGFTTSKPEPRPLCSQGIWSMATLWVIRQMDKPSSAQAGTT